MDLLCLLADGDMLKPAKSYRDDESKKIKLGQEPECRNAESNRKNRREKAGKVIKLLESNNYIIVNRTSGKRNKIQLKEKK